MSLTRRFLIFVAMCFPTVAWPQSMPAPTPNMGSHPAENGEMLEGSKAIAWTLTYNSDLNANISGGQHIGSAYLQRVGLIADADLDRLIGWRGAKLHGSVHAISGRGLSAHNVGNILTVSGIEAEPALRLFNLWVEQSLPRGGSLRTGQFTAGQEFMLSSTAALFINSTFGWPASFATDLPSGGPAYPLAAPGVRLALDPGRGTEVRIALFAGDPAGAGSKDPQQRDLHGFNGLRLKGSPFLIGEVSHEFGVDDPRLKVLAGGWAHFDRFDDVGEGRRHSGNYALYAIADARLSRSGRRLLRAFVRASASPSDRNPVDLYADAGITLTAPLRSRPDDSVGLAFGIARISPSLISLVRRQIALSGGSAKVPHAEAVVELTYQLKLRSRDYLQPDVQWIAHPAGWLLGGTPAAHPPKAHALIVGLRSSLVF